MKKLMSEYFKEESENDDDEPHNSLYHTLSELTDLPQPWDQYDETSNLIPLSRFHDVVLIPHIVASLISEDLNIPLDEAVEMLGKSRKYGLVFHSTRPVKVDVIVPASSSQPPRHRKPQLTQSRGVKLIIPEAQTLSLDDFPAPGAPKAPKPAVKAAAPVSSSKTNSVAAPKRKRVRAPQSRIERQLMIM
ncbi:hypothetical protein FB45DRAFT_55269 [Roridomyces roridus]|uniref:Restriction of telomere capping protein 4 C-terminal domain-containing protein n=1 Tax=Roridomyces roridus TaxID=1738132 RepID=A0AAD7FLK6_9AGAR|nr:hypothetical protein FB45DRAFT_55269 [Roridomyces roridus]